MRRVALATLAAACVLPAASASGDLALQIQRLQGRSSSLQRSIGADSAVIDRFQARIGDVQQRLDGIEASLAVERALLERDKRALRSSRAHLLQLRVRLAADRQILARQVVASYEQGTPDIVTVVFEAQGFADLLERMDRLRAIGRQDAKVVRAVRTARGAVAREVVRYKELSARQQRVAASILVQRNEVDALRLRLVRRQAAFVRSRSRKRTALAGIDRAAARLQRRLDAQQQAAIAAVGSAFGYTGPIPTIGSFTAHGGSYGFFPAPGTEYSIGEEPELASRLDALGRALQLHLIGLSGYRTPQHSVEVGGFANDPHTRGGASDTPGIEGVPEATLNRFGLTRPFGGAAEADHIQLLRG